MSVRRKQITARFGEGGPLVIEDPEAFKVLYEPVRFKIVGLLRDPLTAKELADRLGKPLTSLYYHLNLLVDHGLVKVDEERVKGRTVERVFRRAADAFAASGAVAEVVEGLVDEGSELASAVRHLRNAMGPTHSSSVRITMDKTVELTTDQAKQLASRLRAVIDDFASEVEPGEDTRDFRVLVALGDSPPAATEQSGTPQRQVKVVRSRG